MREKWLQEVFDSADASRKGLLDEWETIALMKKLNNQLCTRRLKQKIMEFDFGKDEEDRGRINKNVFVTLFNETATRPDIFFILVRFVSVGHVQALITIISDAIFNYFMFSAHFNYLRLLNWF